jgi:hypothetical protein
VELHYLLFEVGRGRRSSFASDPLSRSVLLPFDDEPAELSPEGRFHLRFLSGFRKAAFFMGSMVRTGVVCGKPRELGVGDNSSGFRFLRKKFSPSPGLFFPSGLGDGVLGVFAGSISLGRVGDGATK